MSANAPDPKLRVAFFVDYGAIPVWVARLEQELRAATELDLVAVLVAPDRRRLERGSDDTIRWQDGRLIRSVKDRLQSMYRRLVDRNANFSNAWQPAPEPLFGDLPTLQLDAPVSSAQRDQLREFAFDVVVHCGLREVDESVLVHARLGVWSILGCTADISQERPAGFWPAMRGEATTRSILSVSFADRAPLVAAESWMGTSLHSTRDNVSRHYWKMLFSVPRALRRLVQIGEAAFWAECHVRFEQTLARRFSAEEPGVLQHAMFVTGSVLRKIRELLDTNLFDHRWRLRRAEKIGLTGRLNLREIQDNPPAVYRADPFLHTYNGETFLFFEEFCDKRDLGHLSVLPLDANGHPSGEAKVILERPYHLSYPQVFFANGEHYMVPESYQNKTIELYRARSFPYEWELEAVLIDQIDACDATLFEKDGLWWMFANVRVHSAISSQDECFLYFSEQLTGPWQPHPMNPVVSDCRRARPAGAVLDIDGRFIRPTQDSTFRYGYGLNFVEITELSTTSYSEVLSRHMPPQWRSGSIGMHTYAEAQNFAYVDELYRAFRWKK
ncbi:MAG: hypothetical protein AAGL69_06955 [Pseudomonadota bacterium]